MRNKLLLICVLAYVPALCSCSRGGSVVRPDPPKVTLQTLPVDKMAAPSFGSRARSRMFQTGTGPTPGLSGSKVN